MINCKKATFLATLCTALLLNACVSSETVTRRTDPSDEATDRMFDLGAQYYRNGNYPLARDRLERAVELDSRNAAAHSLLALTLVQLGNMRLAAESFNRAVRLKPNDKDVRNTYGIFLCEQGEFDDALEQFDRAIRIVENDTRWIEMTNAGVCVVKKPDLARAEEYFRDALQLRPAYGEALMQMAALKFRNEDFLTARAFVQRYLASHPPSPTVLYLGVRIETNIGDQRAASDYQNQLLNNFPESAEAQLLLRQTR
jgi:type IV pilus assembly protein PilF